MRYVESQESINLMRLNQDYLNVFYSIPYQKYINKHVRKLDLATIGREFKTGYFAKRLRSIATGKNNQPSAKDVYVCPESEKRQLDTSDRIAIYTVIIGGYDTLKQPLFISPQCDYYVVTDSDINTDGTVWKKINTDSYSIDPKFSNTKKARYVKTHPEVFFSQYKYSIFLDGNFQIIADLCPMIEILGKNSFGTHLHISNDCIYQEGKDIIALGKSSEKDVDRQLDFYKHQGFPEHYGLFETNVLVREHNNEICKKIDDAWWQEMERFTLRDQLSLTYVLWKLGIGMQAVSLMGINPRKNPRLRYMSHK